MHPSAKLNCEKFIKDFVSKMDPPAETVLEVGSGGDKTLRRLFKSVVYKSLDILKGDNVDIVADFPYLWPIESASFDVVISSSCLEHVGWPWETFVEMHRVVRPGGYIYICVPSTGPVHPGPMDLWRFTTTSVWDALAEWVRCGKSDLRVVKSYIDRTDPTWNDNVGILRKEQCPPR